MGYGLRHKRVRQWHSVIMVIPVFLALSFPPAQAYYLCTQPDGSQLYTDAPDLNCIQEKGVDSAALSLPEKPKQSKEKRKPTVKDQPADSISEFMDLARQGDAEAVRSFLASGMDPDVRDNSGFKRPALIWASAFGNIEVIRALLEYGGDVDASNSFGITPLMAGAMEGKTEAVRLLLEKGADVNARQENGKTALMFAAAGGRPTAGDIVELLLEGGASINAANDDGGTALIVAAANGYGSLVEKLIAHGADLDLVDKQGKSALAWAVAKGHQSSVAALEKAGAGYYPGETLDYNGRNKQWWQNELRAVKESRQDILLRISNAQQKLSYYTPEDKMWWDIQEELRIFNQFLYMYDEQINKHLPEKARKAGAPPGWLRE